MEELGIGVIDYQNRRLLQIYICCLIDNSMNDHGQEKLDSESIRQGLMSIRNSQIELLNQLKNETQQLKNTPFRLSTQDSKTTDPQSKMQMFTFPHQNVDLEVRQNPLSPSPIEKPFSFGYTPEKNMESELHYLKDENKMLNETIQKMLYSRSLDKQRVRQLESYLYFSSKIHLQLYSQILNGTPIAEVRNNFQNDMRLNEDVYAKYQENNHELILQLLQEKEADCRPFRQGGSPNRDKEKEISLQLADLKEQLVTLMRNNQGNDTKISNEQQGSRLREHNQILTRKCEELQRRIKQLQSDNKELALCWQRQISERKKVGAQLDRLRNEVGMKSERQRHINFAHQDLEMKLNNAHNLVRQKQKIEAEQSQNIKRLSETVGLLKEENEKLKREIKSIEELRTTLQKDNLTASKIKENDLIAKLNQQTNVLRTYEQQILDLRTHLGETQKNLEAVSQMNSRQRQVQASNQELYWKKMQAIKTNSTVQHLWQVKRVEYDNINQLLQEIREKGNRL